jgi:hypothetical protein
LFSNLFYNCWRYNYGVDMTNLRRLPTISNIPERHLKSLLKYFCQLLILYINAMKLKFMFMLDLKLNKNCEFAGPDKGLRGPRAACFLGPPEKGKK